MAIDNGTAMSGENGDRKFTVNGRSWRGRVKKKDEAPTGAPMRTDAPAIPSALSVVVSVSLLDSSDKVMKDGKGRLMVFDPEVITFQQEAMEAGIDPQATILEYIEKRIVAAEAQLASREKLQSAMDLWGSETPVKDPAPPPADATVAQRRRSSV